MKDWNSARIFSCFILEIIPLHWISRTEEFIIFYSKAENMKNSFRNTTLSLIKIQTHYSVHKYMDTLYCTSGGQATHCYNFIFQYTVELR